MPSEAKVHGVDCEKVPHAGTGYLHAEDDDSGYDVDGVIYCGRCHMALFHSSVLTAEDKAALDDFLENVNAT